MVKKSIPPIGIILFLLLFLLLISYRILAWNTNSNNTKNKNIFQSPLSPFDPLSHCTTNYGTRLGVSHNIPAFSNCHRQHRPVRIIITRFGQPEILLDYNDGTRGNFISGTPWVESEYVARFLFHHRAVTFFSTPTTQEVWGTRYFYNPVENMDGHPARYYEPIQIANFEEGKTRKERKRLSPKFADIVIWPEQSEHELREGHIAVVVDVEDDIEFAGGEEKLHELQKERLQPQIVYIAEQNFDNKDWEGKNYSRILKFHWKNGKEAVLQDPLGLRVLGLLRIGKPISGEEVDERGDL